MTDLGFTHIALTVTDMEASLAFYADYAGLDCIHRRGDGEGEVAWIADGRRPFAIVLIQKLEVKFPLKPSAHLGVAVSSVAEVDRLADKARGEGILIKEPVDSGPPVGYWCLIADPDDHTLELAYGQEVEHTTESRS